MPEPAHRALMLVIAVASTLSRAGCASMSASGSRSRPRPLQELQLADTVGATPLDANSWPAQDWWTAFGDAQLDRLESEALADNPSLKIVQARVDRAAALADTARASLLPHVGADLSSTRERFSAHDVIPKPYAGSTQTESRLGVDFSYELDFWGQRRAARAAALDRVEAANVDVFAARLVLSTAVAIAYVELARSDDRIEIARKTLEQQQRIYDLTRQRVAAGLDTRVELRHAEAQLPVTRQEIATLEEKSSVTRHQLAALLGQGPDRGIAIERPKLPAAIPALALPSQLPADLLGRRPDVAAYRLRVQAAAQDVQVARAQFYPNINLLALVGFQSIGLSQFIDAGSRTAGIGPALRLPIFEGGRLRADLAGSQADYDLAVEQYNSTLTRALRELADQLAAFQSVAIQINEQKLAMEAAREAYDLSLERYDEGVGSYLSVLSAQTQVLGQENLEADLRLRERTNHINLVRALGGGFEARTQPLTLAQE